MLKRVVISLVILIVSVFLIIPSFLSSQYDVQRSIVINKSRIDVYSRIINLETWYEWSPWYAMEPTAEFSFEGIPGVVGSFTTWKGEKIGSGKQTLTKVISPEYVETELEFNDPNPSKATGYWNFTETTEGTKVTWGIRGSLPYPLGRLMGLFMDSMLGKDFEKGLNSLKSISEK